MGCGDEGGLGEGVARLEPEGPQARAAAHEPQEALHAVDGTTRNASRHGRWWERNGRPHTQAWSEFDQLGYDRARRGMTLSAPVV